MEWIVLIAGFLLLGFVLTDFFFTTLSSNGAAGVSTTVNKVVSRVWPTDSSGGRVWSGAIHLIATLLVWITIVLAAGTLIYASFDDMVLNSSTKIPADLPKRIYVAGFVFSTLGTGDYVPGSDFSRYFSVTYSIIGFGLLTTAITYIINVMNSANDKKSLAAFISSMGDTPLELFDYFTTTPDGKLFTERIDELVSLLNTHIINHLCYPIVHYFLSDFRSTSANVQLASLHEATKAMRFRYRGNDEVMAHLDRVDRAMNRFLDISRVEIEEEEGIGDLPQLRKQWADRVPEMARATDDFSDDKRKVGSLLQQFDRSWEDVYAN
jgi:hypothetical protein